MFFFLDFLEIGPMGARGNTHGLPTSARIRHLFAPADIAFIDAGYVGLGLNFEQARLCGTPIRVLCCAILVRRGVV